MSDHGHDHGPVVRHEQVNISDSSMWKKLPMIAGAIGLIGLVGAFAMKGDHGHEFYFSYLTAAMFWLALGLGGLFFVLIQHAARAGWSIVVRRIAENMALTLPVMGLLILPAVFLGAHDLFHWTHAEVVEADAMLKWKEPYLNEGGFRIRAVIYIALWSAFALFYWRNSTAQDTATGADVAAKTHKMRWAAPLGIAVFALSLTFSAFDWLMSLDPHWFSTIFGAYYFAGAVVSTHAFIALIVILLHRSGYLRGVVTKEHFHDLGKMMFAFTVFWAYMAFSQYMLIWYATIPEETEWFSYRGAGDFLALSIALVFLRFVFPFFGLISRHIKRNPKTLAFWAVWILVAEFVDMFWLIKPVLPHNEGNHHPTLDFGALDILTFVGMGGCWLAVVTWGLSRKPLVPMKDPRLAESVHFENF
ncbi:MAG: quinol:cytochrome C oxidoreductase [Myxococcota bacterium]